MSTVLTFNIEWRRNGFRLHANAEISAGITGIFGASGHGKTSVLNAVAGIVTPDSGSISILGNTVFDAAQGLNVPIKHRKVGYVFQDVRLFPHLNVEKNLKYAWAAENSSVRFDDVVQTLQLGHLLNKKPAACSGGEKQRVAIGRAILSGSQILLMDEPFSALDVKLRKDIIPLLMAVNQTFGIPLLIVSHDLPDLLSLTENLILMENGHVVAHDKFQNLILNERNLKLMHSSGWYNVLNLFVFAFLKSKNMVLLRSNSSPLEIQALSQFVYRDYEINQALKVLIKPENIAISRNPVPRISLRNQIYGTIKKIMHKNGLAFCIVDVGENIIVEITEASQINMDLKIGSEVYCLFKSAALKII